MHVVIFTAHDDLPLVEGVVELLRATPQRSVSIVQDERGGLPWWRNVVSEIRSADLVVMTLSPASLRPSSPASSTAAAVLAFSRQCSRPDVFIAVADLQDVPLPTGVDPGAVIDCRVLDVKSVPALFGRVAAVARAGVDPAPEWVPEPPMPVSADQLSTVFISYRRTDTQFQAEALRVRLEAVLGSGNVFHDIVSIDPGVEFPLTLESAIGESDVTLVLIGPKWLEELNARLDQAETDHVRAEVRMALTSGKLVVPLFVDGTNMPSAANLPDDLRALAERSGLPLRPPPDFGPDIGQLMAHLGFTPVQESQI